jgi:hypothetical protein
MPRSRTHLETCQYLLQKRRPFTHSEIQDCRLTCRKRAQSHAIGGGGQQFSPSQLRSATELSAGRATATATNATIVAMMVKRMVCWLGCGARGE